MADAAEPAARRAMKFALVLLLHAAVLGWLLEHQIRTSHEPAIVRMDVRMIDVPPPVVDKPRPPPERNPAAVTAPPPIMTAAESAPAAAFAVAPQPPAPPREIPATAPVAPRAAPVAVAEEPPPPVAVTAARFDADYLNNPPPVYPAISRRLREEGQVLLLVHVSAEGTAAAVHVRQGSGFARLDEAALAAVRQWRFVPARRGVQAIASTVVVPIVFTLRAA